MKFFMIVFFGICIIFPSYQAWTGEAVCPTIGTKVDFRQADEVYDFLSSHTMEKDEFETTAQFEKRRDEMTAKLAGIPVMVIKNNWYFSDFGGDGSPKYDADYERFVVDGFICENIDEEGKTILWPECRSDFSNKFICDDNRHSSVSDADFKCVADIKKEELGLYQSQNAYGASVTVEKIASLHHEILWNLAPDTRVKLSYSGKPIFIEAPIEQAKILKDKLQIGFVVKLKEPFFSSDVMHSAPTRDHPVDLLMSIKQIIVELLCVVVTDEKNQILKSFEPYQ